MALDLGGMGGGLGLDFGGMGGGMGLDFGAMNAVDPLNETFTMSATGHVNIEGIRVGGGGISKPSAVPAPASSSASGAASASASASSDALGLEDSGKGDNFRDTSVRIEVLGQGASGTVYKMVHIPTFTIVAAKMIPMYDPQKRHLLKKELKALYENLTPLSSGVVGKDGSLLPSSPCPYIVSFFDAFTDPAEGTLNFVMEYMDGGSLEDIVETGGCSSESALANISWRVLKGLEFIHNRNQIHRDIKPSNLLISHTGDVKISDFGLIKEMGADQQMAQTFVGTLTYMSPERIAGEPYGVNSDVWSFGLTMLTCAVGKFPLDAAGGYWTLLNRLRDGEPPEAPDTFSAEFRDFIRLSLLKNPAERPTTTQLLLHPFVRDCAPIPSTEPPPIVDLSNVPGMLTDLAEIAKKVQQYRYKAAAKKGDRKLPRIATSRFESLARQMGIPTDIVVAEFNKRQLQANEQLKALYAKRRPDPSRLSGAPRTRDADEGKLKLPTLN